MTSTKRLALFGVGTVLVGAVVASVLVVQSKRAAYVRETMSILPRAESEYAQGRFSDAALTAGLASACVKKNSDWFRPEELAQVASLEEFLTAQSHLWKEAEGHAANADPAKARAGLEPLTLAAARGAPRTQPMIDRLQPLFIAALDKERGGAESAASKRIPEAAKAYEEGKWDELLAHLEAVGKILASLPPASRDAASKSLDKDMKPVVACAGRVGQYRQIGDSKEEGHVKADQLRDLVRKLEEPAGRDKAFRRELLKAIGLADEDKRTPVQGIKLRSGTHKSLMDALTRGGDYEILGDPADTSVIELQGPVHRFAVRIAGNPPQALVEADRVRVYFGVDLLRNHEADCLTVAAEISRSLRAARHAKAFADEGWTVHGDAPGRCAVLAQEKKALIWLDGRILEGDAGDTDDPERVQAFLTAARALEVAVKNSAAIPEEIKGPVSALLSAAHSRAPPQDHLDGEFCRSAIHSGYLEAQLPKIDEEVAKRLQEYRKLYAELIQFSRRLHATSPEKAVVSYGVNMEGRSRWRLHDPAANVTIFSSEPLDHMNAEVVVHSVFSGKHEEFPSDVEPVEIRMVQPMTGVIARWKFSEPKLQFDPKVWTEALGTRDPKSRPEHFGSGDWQVPPHALKVDARGQARELIVPAGALKVGSFAAIAAGPERRKAQDAFLQRCSELLRTPGELHLFYRYFVQYVLDSPVTTAISLIGSSRHTGDVHQDAFQTLDRRVNDRFLADCDDLAELYWNVLGRQGRQAFVLGVPGHATCGVAEKDGEGWRFFCVDTGPPRQLTGPDLDSVVEKLLRTYDNDGGMQFDPRSMQFLFRFAGEQTRSDYYLDSRILRDPAYAELMIRVQEYWHFGFYALGIETMLKVLETDKMPANCAEIAGLYGRVDRHDEALKWARAAIDGLDPKDHLSRVNEHMRVINALREMKQKDEAAKVLAAVAKDIAAILKANPREAGRLRWSRFQMAASYSGIDRPWEGWALVRDDVQALVRARQAPEQLMAGIIAMLAKAKELQRTGLEPTSAQEDVLEELEDVVGKYTSGGLFKGDDSGTDHLRKYGQLYTWYAARLGPRKAVEDLVKAEFPKEKRNHVARRTEQPELDWAWIRVTPISYLQAVGDALDKESKEAGGAEEAIKVVKALEAALPEMRQHGSLGTFEFMVLDMRLIRACLENDVAGMKAVFEEMKRQAWGRLYEDISRTLGRMAAWMKLEDFEKAFKLFCEYQVPRRHYYGAVYAALGADAREHALAASKICRERFPDDADMRREDESLRKVAQ